jgi:EAL domain-containing protein (putative c-di-GMP-specific phosphodiesterase class I)
MVIHHFHPKLSEQQVDATLVPCYQPIIDVRGGKINAIEVLARKRIPQGQVCEIEALSQMLLHPRTAIEVTRIMMDKALDDILTLPYQRIPLAVAINFTASHFDSDRFANECVAFHTRVAKRNVKLVVELTEHEFLHIHSDKLEVMLFLQQQGIRLDLDDFGTGYSNLIYLNRFRFGSLKVDKEFTHNVHQSKMLPPIMAMMIALAQEQGMEIVAEGVETARQSQILSRSGIYLQQGFHFFHPMSVENLSLLLCSN